MEKLILRTEISLIKHDIDLIADSVEEAIDIYLEDYSINMNTMPRSSKELLLKAVFDELLGSEED